MTSKYQLGRALAAARDSKLDTYGTLEAEIAFEREQHIGRAIDAAGGWDSEVQRGHDDATREYAAEQF